MKSGTMSLCSIRAGFNKVDRVFRLLRSTSLQLFFLLLL